MARSARSSPAPWPGLYVSFGWRPRDLRQLGRLQRSNAGSFRGFTLRTTRLLALAAAISFVEVVVTPAAAQTYRATTSCPNLGDLPANVTADELRCKCFNSCGPSVGPGPLAPSQEVQSTPAKSTYWNHNGSLMTLMVEGQSRKFLYYQPRPGIAAAGAAAGDLVFSGQKSADRIAGTAYIFAGRCGKFPYAVSGAVFDDGSTVRMSGQAPRTNRSSCTVAGYHEDNLVFEYVFSR